MSAGLTCRASSAEKISYSYKRDTALLNIYSNHQLLFFNLAVVQARRINSSRRTQIRSTLHATCLKFGFINSNQLLYLDTTQFFSQSTATEILFSNYLQSNFNFIGTKSVLTKKLFCFIKHFCCCCLNNFIFSSSVHVTSVFVSAGLTSRAISLRKNI